MTVDLEVENAKRWTAHLDKCEEAFKATTAIEKTMVNELRSKGLINQREHTQLSDRLYGEKLYEVLRALTPTRGLVEELAKILTRYCRLLGPVMTRFIKSEAFFRNMKSRQREISKLVRNVETALGALVMEQLSFGEANQVAPYFGQKGVPEMEFVGVLALKEIHELDDILIRLGSVGETALCQAIQQCANAEHQSQVPTGAISSLSSGVGPFARSPVPEQALPAIPAAQAPLSYQGLPGQASSAETAKLEQPLVVPLEVWLEFLKKNDELFRRTLKLEPAVVSTLRSKDVLGDVEAEKINAESTNDAKATLLLEMIEDKSDMIKDVIAVFKNPRDPRKTPALLLENFLQQFQPQQGLSSIVQNHGQTFSGVATSVVDSGPQRVAQPHVLQMQSPTTSTFTNANSNNSEASPAHPATLQVSSQGTSVSLENLPVSGGTPGSINIMNFNIVNKTKNNTNVVSINNNVSYFQANAEAYQFLNFALPEQGSEECQWTSPKNFKDGPCFSKPTKKLQTTGNGLALLLNWSFNTVTDDLPEGIRKNKKLLHFYTGLERDGAEQDTKYVLAKFAELTGNEVAEAHNIATVKQLHKAMEAFRNHALAMDPLPAYITVVVSTHGLNGYQLILDHLGLGDLFKDIVYQLSHEAPGFKGSAHFGADMPRLYFVQACQEDMPAEVAAGIKNDFPNVLNSASNFIVGLATIPSHVSWRHEIQGSYYIKAIFECFAKGRSLHEMLKEVDENIRSSVDQKTSAYVSLDFPLTEFMF